MFITIQHNYIVLYNALFTIFFAQLSGISLIYIALFFFQIVFEDWTDQTLIITPSVKWLHLLLPLGKKKNMNTIAKQIHSYWFPSDKSADMDKWFIKSQDFDEEIRTKFGDVLKEAENGKHFHWLLNKTAFVAHVVLMDQLSRHVYRGHEDSFKNDPGVLIFTEMGIDVYFDALAKHEKMFCLLPYQHSESLLYQEKGMERLQRVLDANPDDPFWKTVHEHQQGHMDTIKRFGRFPKRNKALGRESTPEELAYIQEHPDRLY